MQISTLWCYHEDLTVTKATRECARGLHCCTGIEHECGWSE